MTQVGIRELRQNASALVDKVRRGETVDITNHGRLVARLVPVADHAQDRAGLIADGSLRPGRGDPLELEPVSAGGVSTQAVLDELREER